MEELDAPDFEDADEVSSFLLLVVVDGAVGAVELLVTVEPALPPPLDRLSPPGAEDPPNCPNPICESRLDAPSKSFIPAKISKRLDLTASRLAQLNKAIYYPPEVA